MKFHRDASDDGILIFTPDNRIDTYDGAPELDEAVREIDAGAKHVIVDCSALGYMSSVGLTSLIRLHKRASENGGEVKLTNVSPALSRLLTITRLNQVFRIFATVDEARVALKTAGGASVP